MVKKLVRTGNSLALVLDKPLLEATGIDESTPLEVSTDGDLIVISRQRDKKRAAKLEAIVEKAHRRYGRVFKRLAE